MVDIISKEVAPTKEAKAKVCEECGDETSELFPVGEKMVCNLCKTDMPKEAVNKKQLSFIEQTMLTQRAIKAEVKKLLDSKPEMTKEEIVVELKKHPEWKEYALDALVDEYKEERKREAGKGYGRFRNQKEYDEYHKEREDESITLKEKWDKANVTERSDMLSDFITSPEEADQLVKVRFENLPFHIQRGLGKSASEVDKNTGRNIKETKDFPTYKEAEEYLHNLGYAIGSYCGGDPIGFADAKQAAYIGKWRNIGSSEYWKLDGIILDNKVIFFERHPDKKEYVPFKVGDKVRVEYSGSSIYWKGVVQEVHLEGKNPHYIVKDIKRNEDREVDAAEVSAHIDWKVGDKVEWVGITKDHKYADDMRTGTIVSIKNDELIEVKSDDPIKDDHTTESFDETTGTAMIEEVLLDKSSTKKEAGKFDWVERNRKRSRERKKGTPFFSLPTGDTVTLNVGDEVFVNDDPTKQAVVKSIQEDGTIMVTNEKGFDEIYKPKQLRKSAGKLAWGSPNKDVNGKDIVVGDMVRVKGMGKAKIVAFDKDGWNAQVYDAKDTSGTATWWTPVDQLTKINSKKASAENIKHEGPYRIVQNTDLSYTLYKNEVPMVENVNYPEVMRRFNAILEEENIQTVHVASLSDNIFDEALEKARAGKNRIDAIAELNNKYFIEAKNDLARDKFLELIDKAYASVKKVAYMKEELKNAHKWGPMAGSSNPERKELPSVVEEVNKIDQLFMHNPKYRNNPEAKKWIDQAEEDMGEAEVNNWDDLYRENERNVHILLEEGNRIKEKIDGKKIAAIKRELKKQAIIKILKEAEGLEYAYGEVDAATEQYVLYGSDDEVVDQIDITALVDNANEGSPDPIDYAWIEIDGDEAQLVNQSGEVVEVYNIVDLAKVWLDDQEYIQKEARVPKWSEEELIDLLMHINEEGLETARANYGAGQFGETSWEAKDLEKGINILRERGLIKEAMAKNQVDKIKKMLVPALKEFKEKGNKYDELADKLLGANPADIESLTKAVMRKLNIDEGQLNSLLTNLAETLGGGEVKALPGADIIDVPFEKEAEREDCHPVPKKDKAQKKVFEKNIEKLTKEIEELSKMDPEEYKKKNFETKSERLQTLRQWLRINKDELSYWHKNRKFFHEKEAKATKEAIDKQASDDYIVKIDESMPEYHSIKRELENMLGKGIGAIVKNPQHLFLKEVSDIVALRKTLGDNIKIERQSI